MAVAIKHRLIAGGILAELVTLTYGVTFMPFILLYRGTCPPADVVPGREEHQYRSYFY